MQDEEKLQTLIDSEMKHATATEPIDALSPSRLVPHVALQSEGESIAERITERFFAAEPPAVIRQAIKAIDAAVAERTHACIMAVMTVAALHPDGQWIEACNAADSAIRALK